MVLSSKMQRVSKIIVKDIELSALQLNIKQEVGFAKSITITIFNFFILTFLYDDLFISNEVIILDSSRS